MSAVFSTLREALRPGDAPRQPRQPGTDHSDTTSSSSPPGTTASSNREDTFSSALLAEKQHGSNGSSVSSNQSDQGGKAHRREFLESHRDATGHASVMDSIMPGNQGLPAEESSNPRSGSTLETGEASSRGSGSILGVVGGWMKGQKSTASADDDHRVRAEAGLGDPDRQNEENYTFGQHAEKTEAVRDKESAQPRAIKMDDNIVILSSQPCETTKQKMDELPVSLARESQVSR